MVPIFVSCTSFFMVKYTENSTMLPLWASKMKLIERPFN